MLRTISPDTRRVLLVSLLGDPLRLGENAAEPICSGGIARIADTLSHLITPCVEASEATSAQTLVRGVLGAGADFFDIVCGCMPAGAVDERGRILKERWGEWLRVCWGCDSDSILIACASRTKPSLDDLLDFVELLPETHVPSGPDQADSSIDSHVHSGALYTPSLLWAAVMAIGAVANSDSSSAQTSISIRLPRYARVGRILLGWLLDYQSGGLKGRPRSVDAAAIRRVLDGTIRYVGKGTFPAFNAATRGLVNRLRAQAYSTRAIGNLHLVDGDSEQASFRRVERAMLAELLWNHRQGTLPELVSEMLVLYLRCKNHWFQASCGLFHRHDFGPGTTLAGFREIRGVNSLMMHGPRIAGLVARSMSETLRRLGIGSADIRIPSEAIGDSLLLFSHFDTIFRGRNWNMVISMGRREMSASPTVTIDDVLMRATRAVDSLAGLGDRQSQIVGLDVVGIERDVSWKDYVHALSTLRAHVLSKTGRRPFVAVHCGEDTPFPLRGLLDIWYVFRHCPLEPGDRIGHALDLLGVRQKGDSAVVANSQVSLMWESAVDLASLVGGVLGGELLEEWREVVDSATQNAEVTVFKSHQAHAFAERIRPIVAAELIRSGIVLETCPTSNWRVAGWDANPVRHPIKWWIGLDGRYLVGTDDPGVFPCTLQGEKLAVAFSLAEQ